MKFTNKDLHPDGRPFTQEEFINKIKTDDEFAKKWGELGPIYGKQWRNWSIPKIDSISLETVIDTLIEVGNGTTDEHLHEEASRLIKERDRNQPIDQISNLINDLKINPDSRRLMVNAWNVGEIDQMVLPPCHYGFQVYTRELSLEERYQLALPIWKEKYGPLADMMVLTNVDNTPYKIPTRAISLMWNQRSVDTFLGLPFNIASYGLLLEIIAKEVNMVPDELIGNLGDTHIYSNHIEQVKEQIGRELSMEERQESYVVYTEDSYGADGELRSPLTIDWEKTPKRTREPFPLPKLVIQKTNAFWKDFDISQISHLDPADFVIENYKSHPSIKAPLSN